MKDPEVWDYTLLTAIARGWGLAIRCRTCWTERRWSDRELATRFKAHLNEQVSALRGLLICSCGSRSTVLYFYMSRSLDTGEGSLADIEAREAELRSGDA